MCATNNNDLGLTDASCTCGTPDQTASGAGTSGNLAATDSDLTSSTWQVSGLTCVHCVKSVTEELGRLDGAKNVEVALVSGGISKVTISSLRALDPDAVAAAVDEAGYELV